MTNLRDLNTAVQNATFPSHDFASAVREWIAAATEGMEPKFILTPSVYPPSETGMSITFQPAQVGCPNCGETVRNESDHRNWHPANVTEVERWICRKPAQQSEMPEAVRNAAADLREWAETFRRELGAPECDKTLTIADALESWWRSQPAPSPASMTPELEDALDWLEMLARGREEDAPAWHKTVSDARRAIAAVRAQAAQPQGMRLPETREIISLLLWKCDNGQGDISVEHYRNAFKTALAELDAMEGRR